MIKRAFTILILLLLPLSVNANPDSKIKYQADSVTNHQDAKNKVESTVLDGNVKIEFANLKIVTDKADFNLAGKTVKIDKNFRIYLNELVAISGNELNIDINKKEITGKVLNIDSKLISGKTPFSGVKISAENNSVKINLNSTEYVLKAEQLIIQ